jgi:hypothetical protein
VAGDVRWSLVLWSFSISDVPEPLSAHSVGRNEVDAGL